MKYQEDFAGVEEDFSAFIKKVGTDLFKGKIAVEGQVVSIPRDSIVDGKVKYDTNEEGGSFTIKVSWDTTIDEDDEEEDDEDDEDDEEEDTEE